MKTIMSKLVVLSILVISCNNKNTEKLTDESTNDSIPAAMIDHHTSKIALDYIGSYNGILPCADCEGIETDLSLEDDKNFVLKTKYLGKKDATTDELRGTYSWNKEGNTIILSANENGSSYYFVGENYLKQLDMKGNKIVGDLAEKYVLQKKSDSGELPPPPPPPAPETIKNYSIHSKSLENISLVKNKWRLIELNGKPIESKEMFIKLNSEEGYVAFAGCNNIMGSVEFKDEKSLIKFTKGVSTMMACPDMTIEQEFGEMLEKVDNYSLNGNNLSFNRARMAPLARFEAMK